MSSWRQHKTRIEKVTDLINRIHWKAFSIFVSIQFGKCGRNVVLIPPQRISNLRHVHIEDNVTINRDCWIHAVVRSGEEQSPKLIIREGTQIGMGATISAVRLIEIGTHVLLARNVYISDHSHAFENIEIPIMHQGINKVASVSIGSQTWIGQNACVLPGVKIGIHCVVGANSVVTKSIPDYCVVAGSPAKIIKTYNVLTNTWERCCPAFSEQND